MVSDCALAHLVSGLCKALDELLASQVVLRTHILTTPLPVQLQLNSLLLQCLLPLQTTRHLLLIPDRYTIHVKDCFFCLSKCKANVAIPQPILANPHI